MVNIADVCVQNGEEGLKKDKEYAFSKLICKQRIKFFGRIKKRLEINGKLGYNNQYINLKGMKNMQGLAPMIVWFVVIFGLMYFMMIRPQKKQQKEMQKMLDSLEVGDKIVTIGGICGKVIKLKDDKVWISTGKVSEETQKSSITFEKSAIKTVDKKIVE